MFRNTALARRVSISHKEGNTVIRIKRSNLWKTSIWLLCWFTLAFLFFVSVLVRPLFHLHSARETLYVLPFLAFILVWYVMALRIGVWRAFGVEELVIGHGNLHWERTAWIWKRSLDASLADISDVRAKTPWHALSNWVEFTFRKSCYKVGGELLQDEAREIAHELKKATIIHQR